MIYFLCLPCSERMEDAGKHLTIQPRPYKKNTCAVCGSRRFGWSYDVVKKVQSHAAQK